MNFIEKIANKETLKKLKERALVIDSLKDEMTSLSDEELKNKTLELKEIVKEKGIDGITNVAFAVCREAAFRVLGQFPFLVQIMGALVLNSGDIAEMKTGEGKTLTATMAIYTNALLGKGVHVVTVNEYLTKRDAMWMGNIFTFLGLTVGYNLNNLPKDSKRKAYDCDITYTTNSELGFDYLRDNMAFSLKDKVISRGLNYCIIDEGDSILIDDAKTPLIISGGNNEGRIYYLQCQKFAESLKENEDYEIELESKAIYLTEKGNKKAEDFFNISNLYGIENQNLVHYINNALKANYIMILDQDYIVKDNKVQIVDQNTGRVLEGRAYSEGLHQAIEAKENVRINNENVTLATITYQNFFRLYNKLAGMTGTAYENEKEFLDTYNMKVVPIPTNKKVIRIDEKDAIFNTKRAKYKALLQEIINRHALGQPLLIGTKTVRDSELIYRMITQEGLEASLLNAKDDALEANIVAKAGEKNAITIATNMAGRGTDIKLGEGVKELGGLAVLGLERHEAKRIDNQLRGRAGRQGDPGYSRFYVSLEDDYLRRYGANKFQINRKNVNEIKSSSVAHNVNQTQCIIESIAFSIRSQLLEYDDVLSLQRESFYKYRNQILESEDITSKIEEFTNNVAKGLVLNNCTFSKNVIQKDNALLIALKNMYQIEDSFLGLDNKKDYINKVKELILARLNEVKDKVGDGFALVAKNIILSIMNQQWSRHLSDMSALQEGIYFRQYANERPITKFKIEGKELFISMLNKIAFEAITYLIKLENAIKIEKKESEKQS